MNKIPLTSLQLLQELEQKLKSKEIFFWIDNQDCYLLQWTIHYTNKIKVGDLSLTKENYFAKLMEEFKKQKKERDKREKVLTAKFQEISDVELIDELKKRAELQAIKLSMYSGNTSILIEGKDIRCDSGASLPIEIKKKDQSV